MKLKKEILLLKIEYFRGELTKVSNERGLDDSETIRLSQNLDKLILQYQKSLH